MGCWSPSWIVSTTPLWGALFIFFAGGTVWVTRKRVSEEEAMMKEALGDEWEAWHKKTSRFVSGLF
jgi:protein-S-isoprenylcysteine O-methyltransferase Ste14